MKQHNTIVKFREKIDIRGPDDCWEWKAGRSSSGYGTFCWEGEQISAHRFAWIVANGEIPPDMVVRHSCDNPLCCNPAHLEIGTRADNSRDMVERSRSVRGSEHGNAVLSESDVMKVLRLLLEGETQTKVAAMYGVDKATINRIATGKRWAWLTGRGRK